MVVARPGGFAVAGSFRGASAHRLYIVLSELWANLAIGLSAPAFRADPDSVSPKRACHARARSDAKTAFVLLVAWLFGVVGAYPAGELVHVFVLVGLMPLLLAFFGARDAAVRRTAGGDPDKS
jgi:hypothetical protein